MSRTILFSQIIIIIIMIIFSAIKIAPRFIEKSGNRE